MLTSRRSCLPKDNVPKDKKGGETFKRTKHTKDRLLILVRFPITLLNHKLFLQPLIQTWTRVLYLSITPPFNYYDNRCFTRTILKRLTILERTKLFLCTRFFEKETADQRTWKTNSYFPMSKNPVSAISTT